nr:response regulator transcription factor [uncultured Eisenbergiella sp.]
MARIMVVEDEKQMQDILAEYMRRGGHSCVTAEDGVEALALLKQENADLLILDVMMPHLDGFTVCRLVRERSGIPIILLTAKAEEEDKLKGYEYGADDYMTKPFSPRVLLAKVNALLRRTSAAALEAEALSAGKITLMPAARKVYVDGQETVLTHLEYELLFFFLSNPGLVFTREQLLDRIWGYDFAGNSRTVDTHIKTLRQKLGSEGRWIVTLIRSGYKFEVRR